MGEVKGKVGSVSFVLKGVPGRWRDGHFMLAEAAGDRCTALIATEMILHGVREAAAVRYLRTAAGMRGADLAKLLHVREATVSAWETGKHPIPMAAWITLAWAATARIPSNIRPTREAIFAAAKVDDPGPLVLDVPAARYRSVA